MNEVVLKLLVELVELAAEVTPHIIEAVKSNGELSPEAKLDLVGRVKRARERVAAYSPRDV